MNKRMMYGLGENFGSGFGLGAGFGPTFFLILAWCLFWKGLALWHAAKRRQPWWFMGLLVINTMGILEIIYLFVVAKVKKDELFKR